ncbi:MAG: hypothetical protein ABWJ42_02420 [Sulfolobales archaeon]
MDKVEIYDVGLDPYRAVSKRIVSVPSIYINNRLYYAGVFSVTEATRVIEREEIPVEETFDYDKAVERIMLGFLDSSYIVVNLFLYNDPERIFQFRDFIEAVSRYVFYKYRDEENFENLKKRFLEYTESKREYFNNELVKVLGKILVRDLVYTYWPDKPLENYFNNSQRILFYLYAKNSLGRVGLLAGYTNDLIPKDLRYRVELLRDFIDKSWDSLVNTIYNDLTELLKDQVYISEYYKRVKSIY